MPDKTSLEVTVFFDFVGGVDVERGAGGGLPCFGVFGPVGEIVVDEIRVIKQQPAQTRKALLGCFVDVCDSGGLDRFAVLFPLFACF